MRNVTCLWIFSQISHRIVIAELLIGMLTAHAGCAGVERESLR